MIKLKYNGINYKIYVNEEKKQVIAVCRYAGRNVRAMATCSPEDAFNKLLGMDLAIWRCERKVAKLKIKNAAEKYMEAAKKADEAQRRYDAMKQYYMDSVDKLDNCEAEIQKLLEEVSKQ